MRNIFRYGIISLAMVFGLLLINVDTANAQSRWYSNRDYQRANREYQRDIREARRDYQRRMRNGDYRKARREYLEDIRDARQEYIQNVRRDRYGWYYYRNGRRYHRPFTTWNYRNGYFYRRY